MIKSYTETSQTLAVNENVVFEIDGIKTGCTVVHSPNSTTFTFVKPGFYYVVFNATVSATAAATNPVTAQFYDGSRVISGAISSTSSADAEDVASITIPTIIQVKPSCQSIDNTVNLVVKNIGIEAEYSNVSLTITKLC